MSQTKVALLKCNIEEELGSIKEQGVYNSVSDLADKRDDIKGNRLYKII